MKCPYCHHDEIKVTDSRSTDDNNIRRRRECMNCGKRFTTYEVIEDLPIMVVKRDQKKELFDRSKLMNGLWRSCSKRGVCLQINWKQLSMKQKNKFAWK